MLNVQHAQEHRWINVRLVTNLISFLEPNVLQHVLLQCMEKMNNAMTVMMLVPHALGVQYNNVPRV